jgi:hypothetical protein
VDTQEEGKHLWRPNFFTPSSTRCAARASLHNSIIIITQPINK